VAIEAHSPMKLAVVGGGWAGLAAAVRATEAGHQVTVFEMSAQWGGRARSVDIHGLALDNGQHILIGAYVRTLALMATVGADVSGGLLRLPLVLRYPDGRGLRMPAGPAWLVFGAAVLRTRGWNWRDKLSLIRAALGWVAAGFCCAPDATVDQLCAGLTPSVRELMIDPLCVAALNTPAVAASGAVFLRVLRDALFSGRGSADLLLPRQALSHLLPEPASNWLQQHGAVLRLGTRVEQLAPTGKGWQIGAESFDGVVLACPPNEAARLVAAHAADWAARAASFTYEPIVTVYLRSAGTRLQQPMTALIESPSAPAQFVFDHGAMGATPGIFAFVVSGARNWVDQGLAATGEAVRLQAERDFPVGTWSSTPLVLRVLADKRATFRCVPDLQRPRQLIANRLLAAGDYVDGPYPATLEGAVRSGESAATRFSTRT
jgi:squalene-associated FAD-dependent desaturase